MQAAHGILRPRTAAAAAPPPPALHRCGRRRCVPPRAAAPDFGAPVGRRERRRPADFTKRQGAGRAGGQKPSPGSGGGSNSDDSGSTSPPPPPPHREQRLAKALAAAGVAARRKCEDLIAAGRVAVNGQTVDAQGFKIVPSRDRVAVDGRPILLVAVPSDGGDASSSRAGQRQGHEGQRAAAVGHHRHQHHHHHYFAVHKPVGVICSDVSARPGGRVVDLLEGWLQRWRPPRAGGGGGGRGGPAPLPPRLFTVGRLDVATSGLVLVTNDGAWANRVIHPSAGLTKVCAALRC